MKKILIKITAAFAALVLLMAGCSDGGTVEISALESAMLAADASLPEMMTVSSDDNDAEGLFASVSYLDYGKIDSYFVAYANDGSAYEIAAIAVKDQADLKDLEESLQIHINNRVTLYKNYAADQAPLAEKAEIVSNGKYAALIMCDNQSAVKEAFENALKATE